MMDYDTIDAERFGRRWVDIQPEAPGAWAALSSTLEAEGRMRQMQDRLADDPGLVASYRRAHEEYLSKRQAIAEVDEIAEVTAGGMPDRVKCLHVLVAHALVAGPGVNPFGDEALDEIAGRGLLRGVTCAEAAR